MEDYLLFNHILANDISNDISNDILDNSHVDNSYTDPRDPRIWGPSLWALFFNFAKTYPLGDIATLHEKKTARQMFESIYLFMKTSVCPFCADHMKKCIDSTLNAALETQATLLTWLENMKATVPREDEMLLEINKEMESKGLRASFTGRHQEKEKRSCPCTLKLKSALAESLANNGIVNAIPNNVYTTPNNVYTTPNTISNVNNIPNNVYTTPNTIPNTVAKRESSRELSREISRDLIFGLTKETREKNTTPLNAQARRKKLKGQQQKTLPTAAKKKN